MTKEKIGLGTSSVFLTAISAILSAVLFLRFGFAVGTVGFLGTILIVLIGHLITVPTAMAISEIASNQKVEGGSEYFIISRSFGLNIGATIGIALYLSQAISIAFYVIAFTEAFEPFFTWFNGWSVEAIGFEFPRQLISVPAMFALLSLIRKKGSFVSKKYLYLVVAILGFSLLMFFLGKTSFVPETGSGVFSFQYGNIKSNLYMVFAIVFPAFTGMTAGIGLSGNIKDHAKSIPMGTISATLVGMIIYILIAYKLSVSASMDALALDYYIMGKIALFGFIVIPLALAATTILSAISSLSVAPKTLQSLAIDGAIPIKALNRYAAKAKGKNGETDSATVITAVIAVCFVIAGEIDTVARIISMLFMVTYGTICLISFLYHFGGDPSYRPVFKSKWYLSLTGFLLCLWLMFGMDVVYASVSIFLMVLLYLFIRNRHSKRGGMEEIFRGVIFQASRRLQIFIQKSTRNNKEEKWRPSVICISKNSFERDKPMRLLEWISDKYGFGTYIHLIEDYFSEESNQRSKQIHEKLLERAGRNSNIYIDTIISPSFTSAIAQTIQLPGISGMPNNMILFELDKQNPEGFHQIAESLPLVQAAKLDIGILISSAKKINFSKGIHIWIKETDVDNSNLMILLGYVIVSHHEWSNSRIKIFEIAPVGKKIEYKARLLNLVNTGRLPIAPSNIEIIETNPEGDNSKIINEKSLNSGLTIIGFNLDDSSLTLNNLFDGYESMGDILYVNAQSPKKID